MASNFDFMAAQADWADIMERAQKAEQGLAVAPEFAAIFGRSAMELGIKWVYHAEGMPTEDPYHYGRDRDLFSLLKDGQFQGIVGSGKLLSMLDQLRLFGNNSAHGGRSLSRRDGELCVRILFAFVSWMAYCYTQLSTPTFDEALLPKAGAQAADAAEAEKLAKRLEKQDEALAESHRRLAEQQAALEAARAENERLQAEMRRMREEHQKQNTFAIDPVTEAETRRRYIDYDLEAAGWTIGENCRIEEELSDMPNATGTGFADYVLYGRDGKPLAVVEAKRTAYDPDKGVKQARLYADSIEHRTGRRPFIFLTNGFRTLFLDEVSGYPRREVSGFFTQEDLELRMARRSMQKRLSDIVPNADIAGRPYQLMAVGAVSEAFDNKHRRALVVQATGTGKTRVAISMTDVLFRGGWVKRVLFLADRTALVRQAKRSFLDFFADELPMANLLESREEVQTARVVFSTYPTMMNAIDDAKNEEGRRLFSPGSFDCIIIDESHRSIYQQYQAIFRYFDALLLGLTATPKEDIDKNTYREFGMETGDPTFSYSYDEAIAEGHLVPFEQFERTTKLLKDGLKYKDLSSEDKEQYEQVFGVAGDNAPDIENTAFNKYVFNRDTVRGVLKDLMELGQRINGGDTPGKTIIFAKNRRHAAFVVDMFHEMYPELGDAFVAQIDGSVDYCEQLIDDFRTPDKYPQIAVSVDMLDTGIDVPEILNLVFFKMVRSYSKFWQMIGRGTRLCKNIFGPGMDKKKFYIFDYGGNFEFFSLHADKLMGTGNVEPLSARIYNLQAKCYLSLYKDEKEENRGLAEKLLERLHGAVLALDDTSFRVIQNREAVQKFRDRGTWERLTDTDVAELKTHIAPIIMGEDEDIAARFFDATMLRILDDFVSSKDIMARAQAVEDTAEYLLTPTKQSIPQVKAREATLRAVQTTDFWMNATAARIEQVREELRSLMKFVEKEVTPRFYTDFTDTVETVKEPHVVAPQTAPVPYKKRVEAYLREHQTNTAVFKLRTNKRLTKTDLEELERVLWQELGTAENYHETYGDMPVGRLVRETVGMEHAAVEQAFAEFLQENRLNSRQMDFVKRIISYFEHNGILERQDIATKAVFKSAGNIAVLFKGKTAEVQQILAKVNEVTRNGTEIDIA